MRKEKKKIKTERDYIHQMRDMVQRVIDGKNPLPDNPTRQDLEILTECINQGYLFSAYEKDGKKVLRTLDGNPHPHVDMGAVPLNGYAFVNKKLDWISILSIIISLIALVKSFIP